MTRHVLYKFRSVCGSSANTRVTRHGVAHHHDHMTQSGSRVSYVTPYQHRTRAQVSSQQVSTRVKPTPAHAAALVPGATYIARRGEGRGGAGWRWQWQWQWQWWRGGGEGVKQYNTSDHGVSAEGSDLLCWLCRCVVGGGGEATKHLLVVQVAARHGARAQIVLLQEGLVPHEHRLLHLQSMCTPRVSPRDGTHPREVRRGAAQAPYISLVQTLMYAENNYALAHLTQRT